MLPKIYMCFQNIYGKVFAIQILSGNILEIVKSSLVRFHFIGRYQRFFIYPNYKCFEVVTFRERMRTHTYTERRSISFDVYTIARGCHNLYRFV